MIYLDNSATTFPKPECVYTALDFANRNLAFNAGRGTYKEALKASEIIDEARSLIASFVKSDSSNVTFLSSATEALNLIINGLDVSDGDTIYISPFEHNAIVRPLYNLKKNIHFNIEILPFDKETWELDEEKTRFLFATHHPKAVLISHISNVTGYILPYQFIFSESKKYQSVNVLDCAQSFGILIPECSNLDFIVFAGHKSLYASFGVAGFIDLKNTKLKITKSGGNGSDSLNHEMPDKGHYRYESGSSNVVAIYSLISSIKWIKENSIERLEKELTNYLVTELRKIDKINVYIPQNMRNLGIVSFNIEGYRPEDVASILSDEFEICVRSGYHCAPFVHEFLDTVEIGGTVRVSIGAFNKREDIDALIEALKSL